MNYEERQYLRESVAAIQRAKEKRARRMWIKTIYRRKLYLGGDSRPMPEQNRAGYPANDATDYFRKAG